MIQLGGLLEFWKISVCGSRTGAVPWPGTAHWLQRDVVRWTRCSTAGQLFRGTPCSPDGRALKRFCTAPGTGCAGSDSGTRVCQQNRAAARRGRVEKKARSLQRRPGSSRRTGLVTIKKTIAWRARAPRSPGTSPRNIWALGLRQVKRPCPGSARTGRYRPRTSGVAQKKKKTKAGSVRFLPMLAMGRILKSQVEVHATSEVHFRAIHVVERPDPDLATPGRTRQRVSDLAPTSDVAKMEIFGKCFLVACWRAWSDLAPYRWYTRIAGQKRSANLILGAIVCAILAGGWPGRQTGGVKSMAVGKTSSQTRAAVRGHGKMGAVESQGRLLFGGPGRRPPHARARPFPPAADQARRAARGTRSSRKQGTTGCGLATDSEGRRVSTFPRLPGTRFPER